MFRTKEPHQKCELFSTKMVCNIMRAREIYTTEEFDKFISEFVDDYTKTQDNDIKTAMAHFMPFMEKLIDVREAMHK
jgi:hypothetical protein